MLFAALPLLLLAACQKPTPLRVVPVDSALAALVPPDTVVLAGARIEKLRETSTYKKYFNQVPLPRLDDFVKDTGLDPRKDISEVLVASDGKQSGLLLVRGQFSTGELESRLEKQGSPRTTYKNHTLLGDNRNSVLFLNSSTALAGSTAALKQRIDHPSAGGVPAILQQEMNAVPADAQIWAVFRGSAIRLPIPADSNLGNLNNIVQSIQNGRFSADLRNGLEFQANGACNTDASAKQINETLRGIIGIGRLSTPENQPDLLRVYDGITVRQAGTVVSVAAAIPAALLDKFINSYAESKR